MFEVVQATVAAFGMFLASPVVIRHHDPRDERREKDLRLGLVLAGAWSFVVAAHYANKTNSSTPYVYWLGASAIMVALYEVSFRSTDDVDLRNAPDKK